MAKRKMRFECTNIIEYIPTMKRGDHLHWSNKFLIEIKGKTYPRTKREPNWR
jgi:hypothetical protein